MPRTGSGETRLIVLRGNSASGKSSTAAEIRRRRGRRDLSIVGQDNLRREVLREHDVPGGANIALIDLVARYALSHGFNAIVEGIFRTDHYGEMLAALINDHQGLTCCYYFDVPFGETLRRHAAKPQAGKYGAAEMRAWYRELDLLPGGIEQVIPAEMPQDQVVRRIMADSGLAATAAQAPEAGRLAPDDLEPRGAGWLGSERGLPARDVARLADPFRADVAEQCVFPGHHGLDPNGPLVSVGCGTVRQCA